VLPAHRRIKELYVPEWRSFTPAKRDRDIFIAHLSREMDFLAGVFTADHFKATRQELERSLLGPKKPQLCSLDKMR